MRTRVALFVVALLSTALSTFAQEAPNPAAVPPPLGGTGTPNHISKWITTTSIGNSGIFENSAGNVGIGTTVPAAKFDLNGTGAVRDTLTLFPAGTHPTLSISGTAFQISSTGKMTFVAGQAFPGTGTVKTVNSGAGLTGGPIHTTGTLSVNSSVVPFLANANVFTTSQTISGDLLVNNVFGTNVFLNGSAATLVGAGANATAGLAGNPLTVFAGSPNSATTDGVGGDLILTGGNGTGAGGSGAVRIQAAAAGSSGTSADSLVDRQVYAPKSAPMGGQGGTANIFYASLANGDAAGVTVRWTVRANDGASNWTSQSGSCLIAEVAAPNGLGASAQIHFSADTAGFGNGTINAYCYFVGGPGNSFGIGIGDSVSFVPTTHDVYFEIDNVSGSPLTTLAALKVQSAGVRAKLNQRVDALHPNLQIRRTR